MSTQKYNTLDPDLFMKYAHHMLESRIINAVTTRVNKPNLSICDVGGASGVISNAIILKSPFKIKANVLDIFTKYKDQLVNKDINFIHGSIVKNKFKDNSFDFVIFRDVMHHIIVGNVKETQKNQAKAINEIIRITKSGGYIIFEEEINNSTLSSRILFYLSKFANLVNVQALGLNMGKVVVSFMSKKEIEQILNKYPNKIKILKRQFIRWNFSFLWKSTMLMNKFYRAFYIIQKIG